jgi:4-hydroxybenzoate polyprenyltransferase
VRRYLADTSLVFAVLIAIGGLVAMFTQPTSGAVALLVAFFVFAFSFMVKRY